MKIKFLAAAVIFALAAAALTACGDSDASDSSSAGYKSVSDESGESSDASAAAQDSTIASAGAYTVYHAYFESEENTSIGYPQIMDMNDTVLQDKINSMLYDLENSRYEVSDKDYSSYAEVNYCDDSILSLTQTAIFDGGSLETGGYSLTNINLNMQTGEKLELAEVADADALAEKFFSRDGITVVDSYEGADIEDFFSEHHIESAEDLSEYISGSSFTIDENKNIILRFPTGNGVIKAFVES